MALIRRKLKPSTTRPWELQSTFANRLQRILPFLGLVTAALGLVALPPGEPGRFTGLGIAFVGFTVGAALIVLVPWQRIPDWPRVGLVALFCANVAIVRESTGGGRSGFAIVLLLVIVWQAAYGTRAQIAISLVLCGLTLTLPSVFVGGERYPDTEWRKALLFTLVATVVGIIVHELVHRTNKERWVVARVAQLGRTADGEDARDDACRLAVELTGADMAVLLEPEGKSVRITGSAGREVPVLSLPEDLVPPAVWRALRTGEAQVILDTEASEVTRGGVSEALGMRSWVHQPGIGPGGRPAVDLVVAWTTPRRRVGAQATFALPLLAGEAAAIVDRADLMERLDAMSRQDPLTGLLNRRGWDDHLTREIARVSRTGRPLSVALLDLDRFKAFNDLHGHLVGDQLLKAASGAWTAALRTSDVLARWGGEEFVVLMPETDTEDAELVLARMAGGTPMGQTFSAGIITVTTAVDPDTLLRAADEAVYRAKGLGRDRVEIAILPNAAPAARAAT